jgi:hypothetical protein
MIVGKLILNDLIAKWLAKVERLQDRIYIARVSKLNTKKTASKLLLKTKIKRKPKVLH